MTKKGKIQGRNQQKLHQPVLPHPICNEYPTFGFHFLTSNKRYNIDGLRSDQVQSLVARLHELSQSTWLALKLLGKDKGYETLPRSMIRGFDILPEITHGDGNECKVQQINKVFVFRFGDDKSGGRIIGVKQDGCSVFHVLGFDPDFTAYDHS